MRDTNPTSRVAAENAAARGAVSFQRMEASLRPGNSTASYNTALRAVESARKAAAPRNLRKAN